MVAEMLAKEPEVMKENLKSQSKADHERFTHRQRSVSGRHRLLCSVGKPRHLLQGLRLRGWTPHPRGARFGNRNAHGLQSRKGNRSPCKRWRGFPTEHSRRCLPLT